MQWRNQVAGHGVVLPSARLRAGLKNLGHTTCCLNSVMQCLSVFGHDASRGSTIKKCQIIWWSHRRDFNVFARIFGGYRSNWPGVFFSLVKRKSRHLFTRVIAVHSGRSLYSDNFVSVEYPSDPKETNSICSDVVCFFCIFVISNNPIRNFLPTQAIRIGLPGKHGRL